MGEKQTAKFKSLVRAEMLRLARDEVKREVKSQGKKVSWFTAKDITTAAMQVVSENEAELEDKAIANLRAVMKTT